MAKIASTTPSTTSAYKLAGKPNIEEVFEAFLTDLGPAAVAAKARPVVEMLSEFLNNNEATEWRQIPSFTKREQPSAIIPHLDRYLRYNIMRELVLNIEQMDFLWHIRTLRVARIETAFLAKGSSGIRIHQARTHVEMGKSISSC